MENTNLFLSAGYATDTGRVRKQNEDCVHVDLQSGLFIVSDGMGGGHSGALASEIVVKLLPPMVHGRMARLKKRSAGKIRDLLQNALMDLNRSIRQKMAVQGSLKGMGATVVMTKLHKQWAHLAHMGDSRAYLFHNGLLRLLTEDHSIVGILLRHGEISQEEARIHPARGRLSRFIGLDGEVYPDVQTLTLRKGDRLLLCTDGLTGMISDKEIAAILEDSPGAQEACQEMIRAANTAGGEDNITVVVVNRE